MVKGRRSLGLGGRGPVGTGLFSAFAFPNPRPPTGYSGRGAEPGAGAGTGPGGEPAECRGHLRPPERHTGQEGPVCHAF